MRIFTLSRARPRRRRRRKGTTNTPLPKIIFPSVLYHSSLRPEGIQRSYPPNIPALSLSSSAGRPGASAAVASVELRFIRSPSLERTRAERGGDRGHGRDH